MVRRGVMSVWKAILLVIGSLMGVAGVTTLGVYLSGGFDKKVVEPQDIYFSQEVDGQSYYLDSADYSAEFKTSSDFFMTIGSNTENVTEKEITLSFEGQGLSSGEYIEDGVIKVPKIVSVGTPFKVELVKMYDSSIYADAVVGGNSILTAKSSNILLDSISARICVDVPVTEFYILPTGEEKNQLNRYVVYSDTQFSVNQVFGPTKSKFLFYDDTKPKLTFYDIQGENLTYSYETQKFSAGENGVGSVTAYTFSNSYYQRQVLAQYGYTYEEMTPAIMENIKTTILADARLAANAKKYKSSTITLQISSATISSISFAPAGSKYIQTNERFEAFANKYLRLTTNSTSVGDASFGVSVTATAGQANTGALLANMGIKIEAGSNLNILGGRLAKVTAASVTFENYDSTKDYSPTENAIYYLLPNTAPQDYNNYYWQISSERVGTNELKLNFFTKDENGIFTNYYEIEGFDRAGLVGETEKTFNISFAERENEEPPAWSDQETVSMLINYDKDGHIVATSKDLSVDIQKTNNWKDNVYQEIRYFVFVDDEDASKIILPDGKDLTDYFVCSLSGEYTEDYLGRVLIVNGTIERATNEKYKLYEISEGMLIATNSFSGEVKIFVATIQTRADGTPIMDGAKYKIVNTSYVRVVKVESTLSIKNVVSESTGVYIEGTETEDYVKDGAEYYIPATNENILKLKIALTLSGDADVEKLLRAINVGEAEGGIFFTCVDDAGDEIEEYLTLENFAQDISNSTEEVALFEGTFAINQQLFEPDFSVLDRGTRIRVRLSYNNGKEVQSEVLKLFAGGDQATIDAFNIYYPQPKKIEWASEDDTSLYVDENLDDIKVNIASTGQTIKWGTNTINENAVQQINNLLQFKLFDQLNKEIEQTAAGYQILFEETPATGENKILNFNADGNKIASFSAAQQQTTTMQVYVYRARRDQIYEYDESGNVTANKLKYAQTFTFVVTSEGVEKVEYDSTTTVNGSNTPSSYAESENKGAVVVEKYIKFDNNISNTINLASLIKVYVGTPATEVSDLNFYFDSTFISSLSSNPNSTTGDSARQSLLKMIEITGDDDKRSKDQGYEEIENWIGKRLKSFRFYYPFAQNTNIRLVAKDKDESLFNIYIDLVCKPDVYERNLIENKNTEWGYTDYLVEKDNAISIFAGKEYKLDDIIPVYSISENDTQISWNAILGSKVLGDQVYTTDQSLVVSLVSSNSNICLRIEETTNFVVANLTIFIHKTYYAYKINLRLYINPNIIVVSDDARPTLNANDVFSKSLGNYYKIYKATDYVDKSAGRKTDDLVEIDDMANWAASNSSASKYIELDLNTKKFKAENTTLELELGQTTRQDFVLSTGTESSPQPIFGIRKYGDTIIKADFADSLNLTPLRLTFELGHEDENKAVQNAETTKYKDKEYFIFVSGEHYTLASGLAVYNGETYGVVDVDNTDAEHKLVAKLTDRLVSLEGNGFKAKKEISDGTNILTIVSNINVVVFASGDKFVYYNNDEIPVTIDDMIFNYYNADTDFETLVANYYAERLYSGLGENGYTLLEENNVCQELVAGQTYKVLHKSKEKSGENEFADDFAEGDVYGFYYDSTLIDDSYNIDISIVGGATGYVAGLASYNAETKELSINHTESSLDQAYIVLRLSITRQNSTAAPVVWFYRIKVVPSFTLGNTNYPYAEDAEYLDEYLRGYYSEGTYTIDFDEILNSTNSKYQTEKQRIEKAVVVRYVKAEDVKFVAPAGTEYFTDSGFITSADELDVDQEVEFDGESYSFIDGSTTYYVKAENIKVYVDDVSCYYDEACTKEACEITDETEVFKYAENKYRFAISDLTAEETFSIKTAYVNGQEISPDDYHNYFNHNFVDEILTLSPVDDTTKLEIVVSRTLSLGGDDLIGGENTYVLRFNQPKDYVATITSATATITKENERHFSTILKANGNSTTFTIDLKERSAGGSIYDNVSEYWAYVTEPTTGYFTFEFTEDKQIEINTEGSIAQDKTFTIVVYTDTQIAFYIDLTIIGDYTITQNISEVNAGTIVDFDEILSIDGTHTIAFSEPDGTIVDDTNQNIQFSSLTSDRNIEFTITIDGTYSFNITLYVNSNFEVKSRSYNNTTPQYGQKSFVITLADIKAAAAFPEFDTTIGEFRFENSDDYTIDGDGKITITPTNVSNSQTFHKTLTLGYYFNNSQVFTADVTYSYTVYKNVNVVAHYPSPAGTELSVEYVSTEQSQESGGIYHDFENFFGSQADFASQNRIVVENIPAANSYSYTWRLAITSISNLTIRVNGANYTSPAEGLSATADNKYNIRFTLSNGFAEGSATFLVSVNEVEVEYNVIVVNGNNFSITTNAPNYASVTDKSAIPVTANAETIYAEELANQEQTLFAENRILKYAFSSSVANGSSYYLKFENDATVAMAKITSDGTTVTKNVDLGRSYAGYTYKGTYTSYNENTKTFSNLIDDSQIYTTAPKLTKRVVATYRNGEEISSGITLNSKPTENGESTDLNTLKLEENDFQKIKTSIITATINGSDKTTGISYNIYLDSYYSISGVVDSATSYTTIILNADHDATRVATTLLTNSSLGISLTEAQMKQYGGSFSLLTYGFSGCKVSDSEVATEIDNYLKETPDGGIKYSTGLLPRAGATLDTEDENSGDINKNYITISGLQYNGKTYDYNIFPQGANNDGNYVMMKLTYSITISAGQTIKISNDILFKVLPSSVVTFKSDFGSSLYLSSTNILDDQRTIATNQTAPYSIRSNGSEKTFYFGAGGTETNVDINAISARMYNNSTSTAGAFTYGTIKGDDNWDGGQGVVKTDTHVNVKNLVLGERTFYIDATNDFDYKIRFFFRVVAETNPIIDEMSSYTLTEGEKLVVGAKYQTITPTTIKIENEDWAVFNSFTYKKFGEETSFANNLMLQGTYNKARIMFTHSDSKTYYKQWSDNAVSSVDVKTIVDSTEWTEPDTENSQTFAETDLANKTITLYVKFDVPTGTASIASFSAKYFSTNDPAALTSENSEEIAQLINVDTTLQAPAFGDLENDTTSISLTGIKAFAINKNAGGMSTTSISDNESNVTKIEVKKIEFYYNNEIIHDAQSDASTSLITSDAAAFYNGERFENGTKYNSTLAFTVPTIKNGYLFGTGDTISGVTMKITLSDGTNECVVSRVVTIRRNPDTKLVFNTTELYDGESPVISTEPPNETSGNVYNDTLEVTLAPGATTTFTITTKDSSGTETTSTPITLTNPENYSVTRYIGIHANMSGISKIQTSFKINVSTIEGAIFYYNGTNITTKTEYTQIDIYNSPTALNLHIASRRELSSNKKTVRLYFLLNEASAGTGGTKYQYIQDFEVSPEYLDTTYNSSILLVNDYYKISNGSSSFYVIPLKSWAEDSNFTLIGKDITGSKTISNVGSYKFHFEINTSLGGSAFIDENGTITTASNIDLQTEKIFVNIYMKVSGTNGFFEDEDGILIKTIALALNPDVSWTSAQSTAGVYVVGDDIVTIPTSYPTSYTASKTSSASAIFTLISDITTEIGDPSYAYSIDHTLTKTDFENMFGAYALAGTNYYTNPECTTPATPPTLPSNTLVSKADTGENYTFTSESVAYYVKESDILKNSLTNRNYHVVYTIQGETGTYQYTNNLNSWTFPSAGKWLINVVATGRSGGTSTQTMLNKTIYIYDSNSSATEESWALGVNENIPDDFEDYKEIDSTTSELKTISKFAQTNVYTKLYLNTKDGTLKTITWYVYGVPATTKNVAVNVPTSSFRMSNVITDENATIYRYNSTAFTMTPVTYETFNDAANTTRSIKYISVVGSGDSRQIKYYEITYYFTSSTTNVITDVVEINTDQLTNIKQTIATRLGVSDVLNITLETIEQNGELETCIEITPDAAYKSYSLLAIVSGTTTRHYRYTINLYGYTAELGILENYSAANSAYELSNLNSEIAGQVSDISDSTAKTYWTFSAGDNALTAITYEDLSETPVNPYTYYVRLGIDTEGGVEIRYYKLLVSYTL